MSCKVNVNIKCGAIVLRCFKKLMRWASYTVTLLQVTFGVQNCFEEHLKIRLSLEGPKKLRPKHGHVSESRVHMIERVALSKTPS